ncbi:DNA-binding YbaB/EbfC family protein [Nakamurella sp. UYEF19]
MPDLQALLRQAQQMQADMAQAQADLQLSEVTGHAGGGLVAATVTGDGQLKTLTIDPSVVDPTDVETLADLIVAAVRDASRSAAELAEQKMGTVAGAMSGPGAFDGPGGFDLSAFGLPALEGLADDEDYDPDDEAADDDDDDVVDDDVQDGPPRTLPPAGV